MIKEANEAVKSVTSEGKSKPRGGYAKFSPEQQAAIGKYVSLHGNQVAIRHFSKQLEVELKVTSVHTCKIKYLAELNRKHKAGEMDDLTVKLLPVKKHGRPLLLGETGLTSEILHPSCAWRRWRGHNIHHNGGSYSHCLKSRQNSSREKKNRGPATITNNWAKSLLYKMNFVRRRGSSSVILTVANFWSCS